MKAALTIVLKILGGCLAGLASLYLLLVAINLSDEDLTTEARQFVEDPSPPLPTVPEADNAYFAFLGFTSEEGADIHAKGKAIVEAYHKAIRDNPHVKWEGYPEPALTGTERLRFNGKSDALCSKDTPSCLAHAVKSEAAIRQLLQENAALVSRYRGLSVYAAYKNPMKMTVSTPLPAFFDLRQTANLVLTDMARMAAQGRADEAFGTLLDDLALWRRLQPGRQGLIDKMVKTAQMSTDLRILSEMISRHGVPRKREHQLAAVLAPLTDRERDMVTVMRTEVLMAESMRDRALLLSSAETEGGGLARRVGAYLAMPFYQPNATFNRYAQAWLFQMEIARTPSTRFLEQLTQHERKFQDSFAHVEMHWYDWYNPIGKLFFAIGSPGSFAKFPARMHDLDGLMRLVALQAQIKQRGIPDGRVEDYLAKAGGQYHDPYTDKPMQWVPATRSLSFEGYGSGEKKPVEVKL